MCVLYRDMFIEQLPLLKFAKCLSTCPAMNQEANTPVFKAMPPWPPGPGGKKKWEEENRQKEEAEKEKEKENEATQKERKS